MGAHTNVEDLTDITGKFGPWQRNVFIICYFIGIPAAFHNLILPFHAPEMDHWCAQPPEFNNLTAEEWKNLTIPLIKTDNRERYSQCEMYKLETNSSYGNPIVDRQVTVPCERWDYDTSFFSATITDEWDLVCKRSWLISMSQSVYMGGYLTAMVILSPLSDRFGRRPMMLWCTLGLIISGLAVAFSPYFSMYVTFRFLVAMTRSGLNLTAFVLLMEIVGPEHRPTLGLAKEFGWSTGYIMLPGIAWIVRDWSFLQLTVTLPVAFLFIMHWIIPESPRWLLTKGNVKEAENIIEKAVIKNGKSVDNLSQSIKILAQKCQQEAEEHVYKNKTALDLLRLPNMRKKMLIISFNWFVIAGTFYGLAFNTGNIGGDLYLNFFISGLVDIPALLIFMYIIKRFGRRKPLMYSLLAAGVSLGAIIPVSKDLLWLQITLAMLGKFFVSAAFATVYVYSAEIYPTAVRNSGIGVSSSVGRIGSILSPFTKELGKATHESAPLALFAVLTIVGGLMILLLPETNNEILPDTLDQGEQIGKKLKTEDQSMELNGDPNSKTKTSG